MSKVYCQDCKHLIEPEAMDDGVGVTYTDYKCGASANVSIIDCWMCTKTSYALKPSERNNTNSCALYEVKS